MSSEAHVEKVTGLISSIIPASSRDEVRSKYIYSWTKREGSRRRIRRRLKKKSNGRLIKGMALPRRGLAYNDMLPVHNLWLQYMENVLSQYLDKDLPKVYDPGYENFSIILMKADYNGAKVEVTRSKCSSLIGKSGIIAMDTKETFKVVQMNNEVITIPKNESVFKIQIRNLKLTVFGKHMNIRPAERTVKKIKAHMDLDLT